MSRRAIREDRKKKIKRRCKRCKKPVKKLVGGGLCPNCSVMKDLAGL